MLEGKPIYKIEFKYYSITKKNYAFNQMSKIYEVRNPKQLFYKFNFKASKPCDMKKESKSARIEKIILFFCLKPMKQNENVLTTQALILNAISIY